MSVELIRSIRQWEQEAEAIVRQSVEDGRKIVAEAEIQAQKLFEEEEALALEAAQRTLEEAEAAAAVRVLAIRQQVEKECTEIRNTASAKMGEAVELLMGRIVKPHGDS